MKCDISHEFDHSDQRRRWSFSIWGLMQLVLAAAVAVTSSQNVVAELMRIYHSAGEGLLSFREIDLPLRDVLIGRIISGISTAILMPTAALMALSLVFHATGLLRCGQDGSRSIARQCEEHFQAWARLGLAALLTCCVAIDHVFSPEQLGLTVADTLLGPAAAASLRRAVLIVALMACLGWNTPPQDSQPRHGRGRWLVGIFTAPAAALLALFVWVYGSLMHRLIYIAVLGIESVTPLKFADPSVGLLPMDRIGAFYRFAGLASVAALAGSACCASLISTRWLRWRWRLALVAMLVSTWAAQATFLHWVYWDGIHSLSPVWPQEVGFQSPHVAWTALVLDLLLAAIVAHRCSVEVDDGQEKLLPAPESRYFYESRLALALVTVAAAGHLFPYLYWLAEAVDPESCLWLALVIFCAAQLGCRWRVRCQQASSVARCLPPGRFFASWLAVAITLALAAPTLGLFSFIFWLGPVNWVRIFERI